MHRTFISTVIAAAIAITSVSASMAQAEQYRAPMRAQTNPNHGNEAIAGVLAGAAALFIIGKAIENNGGFKRSSPSPKKHVSRHGHRGHKHAARGHGHRHGHGHGRYNRRHRH
ncbi:hypothetical protein [Planktotalea sp.]|uniref:hypothetical protein n=1 Tax=Planktotalea sp. TaxID=2029877 RepID=UPI003296FF7C